MHILSIDSEKERNRSVEITLSDGSTLRCPRAVARDLAVNQNLEGISTVDDFLRSLEPLFFHYGLQRMYDLLGRSDYTFSQIADKLRSDGYPEACIDRVLNRGTELGIIDDGKYMRCFISSRCERGYGRRYITQQLISKGLTRLEIDSCMEDMSPDFISIGLSWIGSQSQLCRELTAQSRKKILSKLLYRGFSYDEISIIFNKLETDSGSGSSVNYLD